MGCNNSARVSGEDGISWKTIRFGFGNVKYVMNHLKFGDQWESYIYIYCKGKTQTFGKLDVPWFKASCLSFWGDDKGTVRNTPMPNTSNLLPSHHPFCRIASKMWVSMSILFLLIPHLMSDRKLFGMDFIVTLDGLGGLLLGDDFSGENDQLRIKSGSWT